MPSASSKGRGKAVRVGLTGGMGSGKSTVLALFRRHGARTLDADAIVHELLANDKIVRRVIRRRFGSGVIAPDGSIDRKALGERVFKSDRDRRDLERILHPRVRRAMRQAASRWNRGVVVMDIPLLFESSLANQFDWVVVVDASRETRLRRLARRGFSRAVALRRMRVQWPMSKKKERADFVINNNGSRKQTQKQVQHLWKKLTQ